MPIAKFGRAVFLDRDGVINENRDDYVKVWDEFQFLDGALAALARLACADFHIVVVSNQSAIGRALTPRERVEEIHHRMLAQIESSGGRVDRVLYCPHRAEEGCPCRKPSPGMLLQAHEELGVNLAQSYFVGDAAEDVAAAYAVGCTPIIVRTGRGEATIIKLGESGLKQPVIVHDLRAAVEWILAREADMPRVERQSAREASSVGVSAGR